MTSLTKEATASLGVKPRDADRSKNFFALGLICWLYSRPVDPGARLDRRALRRQRTGPQANRAAFLAGMELRRDDRAVRPPVRGHAGATLPPGEYTQHHRQHRPGLGSGGRRPAGPPARVPRQLPDHAGVGHPPRAGQAQELRRAHRSRPRTRSRPSARRWARPSPATSASPPPAGRAWPSRARRSAWPSASSCRCWSSTSSAAGRRPGCPPRPRRPT